MKTLQRKSGGMFTSFTVALSLGLSLCLTAAPSLARDAKSVKVDMILAVSWQPGFCQLNQRRTECRKQRASSYGASHFTLHGLWPKGDFCYRDKDKRQKMRSIDRKGWDRLPKLKLDRATRRDLKEKMPGSLSNLQRHEYVKHGTCTGWKPEKYYRVSLHLLEQLNETNLDELFADDMVNRRISRRFFERAAEKAFPGSGNKIGMFCKRGLITELQIPLRGKIDENADLADLLDNVKARPWFQSPPCKEGKIDPVGF